MIFFSLKKLTNSIIMHWFVFISKPNVLSISVSLLWCFFQDHSKYCYTLSKCLSILRQIKEVMPFLKYFWKYLYAKNGWKKWTEIVISQSSICKKIEFVIREKVLEGNRTPWDFQQIFFSDHLSSLKKSFSWHVFSKTSYIHAHISVDLMSLILNNLNQTFFFLILHCNSEFKLFI